MFNGEWGLAKRLRRDRSGRNTRGMQHTRNHSDQRAVARVAVAPATSHGVALLFAGLLALLLVILLL